MRAIVEAMLRPRVPAHQEGTAAPSIFRIVLLEGDIDVIADFPA
jgi:hypothetical protein